MSTTSVTRPEFANAPTVETVLGVQFDQLQGFRSHHYGWFWQEYLSKNGFDNISDEKLLPIYMEEFGVPKLEMTSKLSEINASGIRMKCRTSDRARTIQLQPDKLYLSWNRLNAKAPRYANVKEEFVTLFKDVEAFAASASLGPIRPNLWEVHYVNQVPPGSLWQEPRDWHRVLPTLFPAGDPSLEGLRYATYSGEWHFEIQPEQGRVHVRVAKMVMNKSTSPTLYFSLLARGLIGPRGTPDLVSGMETGHDACIRLFMGLTSREAHAEWGLNS